jgi:hypothetical protein
MRFIVDKIRSDTKYFSRLLTFPPDVILDPLVKKDDSRTGSVEYEI